MIIIEQKLSLKDYKSAFTYWYNSFLVPKLDIVIGILLILFSIIILVTKIIILSDSFTNLILPIFCFIFGVYLLYIKRFVAIRNLVMSVMTTKYSKEFISQQINVNQNGEIHIFEQGSESHLSISTFVGYALYPGYLVLFLARNNIIILRDDAFISGSEETLIGLLDQYGIPKVINPRIDIK